MFRFVKKFKIVLISVYKKRFLWPNLRNKNIQSTGEMIVHRIRKK